MICLLPRHKLGITASRLAVRQTFSRVSLLPGLKPWRQGCMIKPLFTSQVTSQGRSSTTVAHDNRIVEIVQPPTAPIYKPPETGLISKLPRSWIPYAELIRLDKPAGTYYLYFPCLFSTLMAAPLVGAAPTTVLATSLLFFSGALIMRGAGCTINDLWDRNLDPHVERTKLRPIARRAIAPENAIVYLGFQLLAGLGILLQFPLQCLFYGVPSLLFVTVYPLAKRVTNYPQFVLGLTFSWGAMMGFPALGVDLLSDTSALSAAAALYASCVTWTLNYDMIYAYQDIRDDAKVGIKSIALAHEHNAKAVLYSFSAVQVGLLGLAGYFSGAGPIFYLASCGGAALTLVNMVRRVDLKDVKNCWWWFRNGAWITGGMISLGLLGDYVVRQNEDKSPQTIELEER